MLDLKVQLDEYLDHVVERVDIDDIFEERIGPAPVRPVQPRIGRRRVPQWVYGVAAAVAVFLLIGGVAWLSRTDTLPPADEPTESTQPEATDEEQITPEALTVEEALTMNAAYFAAYSDGDIDAMLELFTDHPTVAVYGYLWREPGHPAISIKQLEQLLTYELATGTEYSSPECVAVEGATGVTLRCDYSHHEYVARVAGAPPWPIRMSMLMTPEGIDTLQEWDGSWFNDEGFDRGKSGGARFWSWMLANHFDDIETVDPWHWTSVEEAERVGRVRAQYGDDWVAYLQERGCTYLDDC